MNIPGLPIEKVFKNVRIRLSPYKQTPWELSSLKGEFYFKPASGTARKSVIEEKRPEAIAKIEAAPVVRFIKSSSGSIGAFAKNWWWSTERHQDGEFGESKVTLELLKNVKRAILVIKHSYSQQSGEARSNVYLASGAQVVPKDALHNKSTWWVGNKASLGVLVGSFSTRYGENPPARFDVTHILRQFPSKDYYITVQNLSQADIGIGLIYIEAEGE
jgi:hypothetical protein